MSAGSESPKAHGAVVAPLGAAVPGWTALAAAGVPHSGPHADRWDVEATAGQEVDLEQLDGAEQHVRWGQAAAAAVTAAALQIPPAKHIFSCVRCS